MYLKLEPPISKVWHSLQYNFFEPHRHPTRPRELTAIARRITARQALVSKSGRHGQDYDCLSRLLDHPVNDVQILRCFRVATLLEFDLAFRGIDSESKSSIGAVPLRAVSYIHHSLHIILQLIALHCRRVSIAICIHYEPDVRIYPSQRTASKF